MIYALNIIAMLATIGFGMIGWLKPRYTMEKLDLKTGDSTLGLSEIRAANGALFVGLGIGAIVISLPIAFVMVGCAYAGAAIGRLTSIIVDKSGQSISLSFFAAEVALAVFLVWSNI
ncbi:DUF4345 family protein [Pseudahrensia aquimaris]|uniref:DUF4345 family protein n=1 Tax=Pseudahrensia aquimaris TaxID=744461 RepID=A0ABW3FGB1_9HYPH